VTLGPGQVLLQFLGVLTYFVYYLPECFWGCSVGKGLLGLRVCRATTTDPPGLGRGLLRTALFYVLLNPGTLAAMVLFATLPVPANPTPAEQQQIMVRVALAGL